MKMPKGWTIASQQNIKSSASSMKLTAKKQIKARIDMSEDIAGKGLCPECGKPMTRVFANTIPCLCCFEDRIVLPIADADIEK